MLDSTLTLIDGHYICTAEDVLQEFRGAEVS